MDKFFAFMNASEMTVAQVKEALLEKLPSIEPHDLTGKVAIITGANVGIGYETAKAIASMNAKKIILACRSEERGNAALKSIKESTNYSGEMEVWQLDLSSFENVNAFTSRFIKSGLPLDILVSNAAVSGDWAETKDGYESAIQVNHLSNVLLVSNLYPALKRASELNNNNNKDNDHFPRVVIVASDVHFWAPPPSDSHPVQNALIKSDHSNAMVQYCTSKLYNILFTQAFARKVPKDSNIWIASANPGYTKSELGTKDNLTGAPIDRPRPDFLPARETYEGAKTIILTATSPKVGESGKFYSEMRESRTRSIVNGENGKILEDNVWDDTIALLKKHVPSTPIYDW